MYCSKNILSVSLLDLFCINNHQSSAISWQIKQVGTEGSFGRISVKMHLSFNTNFCLISYVSYHLGLLRLYFLGAFRCTDQMLFNSPMTHSDNLQVLLQVFLTAAWLSCRYSVIGLFQPLGEHADCRPELSHLVLTR